MFSYAGGKKRLAKLIADRLPNHKVYVEVFGGAGWVLFHKEKSYIEVFNDYDEDLVNIYKQLIQNTDKFIEYLELLPPSRALFKTFREIYKEEKDDLKRAVMYLYLIILGFGSKTSDFSFGVTIKRQPKNKINSFISRAKTAAERFKDVLIECKSFEALIHRYDSTDTVFFVDPPYRGFPLYKHSFTDKDFYKLKDVLSSVKGKFLFTHIEDELIKDLFKGYNIFIKDYSYHIGKRHHNAKFVKEMIITNY